MAAVDALRSGQNMTDDSFRSFVGRLVLDERSWVELHNIWQKLVASNVDLEDLVKQLREPNGVDKVKRVLLSIGLRPSAAWQLVELLESGIPILLFQLCSSMLLLIICLRHCKHFCGAIHKFFPYLACIMSFFFSFRVYVDDDRCRTQCFSSCKGGCTREVPQ